MFYKRREERFDIFFILCFLSLTLVVSACSDTIPPGNTATPSTKTSIVSKASPTATPTPECLENTSGKSTDANAPISVIVNKNCTLVTSNYAAGITHIDNSLTSLGGDPGAVNNIESLMSGTITYENTHIMSWGAVDPWPDPSTPDPTDWSSLDVRLQQAVAVGATPVLSLDEAPWWMKGQLQADGSTRVLTAADEWAPISFGARILDNKMGDWLHLVQRLAERYMVAPYNVRYFQIWNELKGYYDPITNSNDITTSPGDPSGPNARHGYTYMYNQVYMTLMKTAQELNIPTSEIQVGGPYVFMDIWRNNQPMSNPSTLITPYGTFDQRPLDMIQYWLQHKVGAGFITFDGSLEDRGGKMLADPMVTASIFADTIKWIRSLDPTLFPGSTTLPIWLSEWFASPPPDDMNADYDNAVKSLAMTDFIKAGGSVALAWGGSGDGTSDIGYWSPTAYYGGGQPHPWFSTVQILAHDFKAGTKIYPTNVSDSQQVAAMASDHHILVINKTGNSINVNVNGAAQTLAPYQVVEVNY